eukprot:TRINITY_DN46849_c0_g1_i1.p1 TRINITY_DN46849_c0_g1~~TRINITY_DN46849_c0_g1_i1.p1  ORF type:complete len:501 (+),score=164.57 TRINITY_DN46849_c0_g1_i1:86-1588(+)
MRPCAALLAAALLPAARGAQLTGWTCDANSSLCNGCARCCESFLNLSHEACDVCIDQKCDFVCAAAPCNVCDACCHTYIPKGAECDTCVHERCFGEPLVQPRDPPPDTDWQCRTDRSQCNACPECCRDYMAPGPPCGDCVRSKCSFTCSAGGSGKQCNVCPECCAEWIPNGAQCDACVRQKCFEGPTMPPSPPAPADSDGWVCAADTAQCNTCAACCTDYIPPGAACRDCANQQCRFECLPNAEQGNTCESVCAKCCEGYIATSPENCQACAKEHCFAHAKPLPAPPGPAPLDGSGGWMCGAGAGECNACPKCCKEYIKTGAACKTCVEQECSFACSGGECNVCSDCCHPYVPNGEKCNACMRQRCRNENEEPPEDSLTPPSPAEPSPPTGSPAGPPTQQPLSPADIENRSGPHSDDGGSDFPVWIWIVTAAGALVLLAGLVVLQKKHKLISRHRGAGPRRRKQMSKLEALQMAELEREAAALGGSAVPYKQAQGLAIAD